ncbi:MAG: RpiB/LacA/LacB family sugar-phosphate isomerase [Planctomycetota bacterium]
MDQALIEQIVSNVLAQLQPASVRPVIELPKSVPKMMTVEKVAAIELTASVITADLLEVTARVGQPLKIGRSSILTPSARDWLHTKRIDWSRIDKLAVSGSSATKGAARWQLIVQTVTPTVKALHDGLKRESEGWKIELVGQPAEAATLAMSSISKAEHDGVAILSEYAEIIACRANRHERVRAAVISDRKQLELTMQHLGVNVICINPNGRTFIEIRNLLRDCAAKRPVAPAGW